MWETLCELLRLTGAPMTPPEPYGAFHITFAAVGITTVLLLAFLLRRVSERTRTRIVFAIGVVLALGETYKQLFYPAVEGAWRADLFPFQLCSVPMYICLALPLCKNERLRTTLYTFLSTYALLGGAASYISPGTMCRPYVAMTLHSFLWHLTLIFLGVWTGMSRRQSRTVRGFFDSAALYLLLCAAAFAVNIAFHSSHPEVNMFYLGPTPSTLPVCRAITAALGWGVNSVLYMLAVTTASLLIHAAWLALCRIAQKDKKEE